VMLRMLLQLAFISAAQGDEKHPWMAKDEVLLPQIVFEVLGVLALES
jgi:hypothetical protein